MLTDMNDLACAAGPGAVRRSVEKARPVGPAKAPVNGKSAKILPRQPEFRPLQRAVEAGAQYPVEALGGLLGPAARVLHEMVCAPLATCAQSVLGAAALVVQGHANVVVDGRSIPLSLFLMTLADSGDRKSAIDRIALYPVTRREKALIDAYETGRREYECASDAWKAAKADALRAGGKDRNRRGIERALADVGEEPQAPLAPILLASEPTFEGLSKLLLVGQPSLGLFSAEGGQFIGGHAMNDDNRLKTSAGLCALWDGASLDRVRAGEGFTKIYGRCLSVHLLVQALVAAELLGSELVNEQGLIARFLIVQPESLAGRRLYVEGNPADTPEIRAYTGRLLDLLEAPLPIRDGTRNEFARRTLPLSPAARRRWIKFHDAVETKIAGEFAPIKAFAAKAAEHVLRLAGVLTLVEDLQAAEIDEPTLQRAIILGEFYLGETLRLAGTAQQDTELAAAARLYAWMLDNRKADVSTVEIYKAGPAHVRSASRARALLQILQKHGHVSPLPGGIEYDGVLRSEAWHVWREDGA